MLILHINITSILLNICLYALYLCKLCLYAWKDAWMWMLMRKQYSNSSWCCFSTLEAAPGGYLNVKIRHLPTVVLLSCTPHSASMHPPKQQSTATSCLFPKLNSAKRDAWSTSMCPNDVQLIFFWKILEAVLSDCTFSHNIQVWLLHHLLSFSEAKSVTHFSHIWNRNFTKNIFGYILQITQRQTIFFF